MVRNTDGKAKPDEEIKRMLHGAAVAYSKVCDKQVLFIHRKNSEDADYHYYETYYGKENFIHLVGCCSNKYVTAVEFYEKCLDTRNIMVFLYQQLFWSTNCQNIVHPRKMCWRLYVRSQKNTIQSLEVSNQD